MKIKELNIRPGIEQNKKLNDAYNQFDKLLTELKKKELAVEIINFINNGIDQINSISESVKELRKQIRKTQSGILKLIEKELKLVPKNHYRSTWMVLGISVFGVPLGVVFGINNGNIGLMGIGIPIGMVIGMAIGSVMDKKAFESGKQLNWETKY